MCFVFYHPCLTFALCVAVCLKLLQHFCKSHTVTSQSQTISLLKHPPRAYVIPPGPAWTVCPCTDCLFCAALITEYAAWPGSYKGIGLTSTSERTDYTAVKTSLWNEVVFASARWAGRMRQARGSPRWTGCETGAASPTARRTIGSPLTPESLDNHTWLSGANTSASWFAAMSQVFRAKLLLSVWRCEARRERNRCY